MPRKPKKEKIKNFSKFKKIVPPQLLRGMKDILPAEQIYWHYLRNVVEKTSSVYGFEKIDTPILEETALFTQTLGFSTDIVEKEMFSFVDKGGNKVTMRPEATSPIARAYIEHGMINLPQPVKLFYFGPMFRYERPQEGRYRQHHQFGFEVLGSAEPVIDAQLILLAHTLCQELKLDVSIQLNSLGCPECRKEYKKVLLNYYRLKKNFICPDCKKRMNKNPLRLLDCKKERCRQIAHESPQLVDHLCEGCKNHFVKVLEHLDEVEIPYVLNPQLVRGMDYYNRTVFEIWTDAVKLEKKEDKKNKEKGKNIKSKADLKEGEEENESLALGGGGRYDNLVEMLGGQPTPSFGFGLGAERIIAKIKERKISIPEKFKYEIFLAQLGESARKKALKIFEELRAAGIKTAENLSKNGLRPQLETAAKLGVKFTLILGQKEVLDGTILMRDMESGVQEVINLDKVVPEVKKRIRS